jgi:hypothetical protein
MVRTWPPPRAHILKRAVRIIAEQAVKAGRSGNLVPDVVALVAQALAMDALT